MSSRFESEVYARRRATPWAEINVDDLLRDLTQWAKEVTLSVAPRPSVRSRFWWSLRWIGEDGKEYGVSAETLQLCLWRAAVREAKTRNPRLEGDPTPALPENLTREEATEGLREVYNLACAAQRQKEPDFVRWPTVDALLEHIEKHGFPTRRLEGDNTAPPP